MRVQGSRLLLQATLFRNQKNYKNQKKTSSAAGASRLYFKIKSPLFCPLPILKKIFNFRIMINKIIHKYSVNYHHNYIKLAYSTIFEEC